MSMLWVICGAGRGVGKTHLADRLCRVLPDSVYAKCGGGRRRGTKPRNFLRTRRGLRTFLAAQRDRCGHVVIESNALAREGAGDVVVYVDGPVAGGDVRKDAGALRRQADVVLARGVGRRQWQRVLKGKLANAALRRAVCDAFEEQLRHAGRDELVAQCKVWLVRGGQYAFGAGVARLLEYVDRCGTLRGAADAARMSYRYAWERIRRAEQHLGWRLIVRAPGGRGGGRSRLSPRGRRLLDAFTRLERQLHAHGRRRFRTLYPEDQESRADG